MNWGDSSHKLKQLFPDADREYSDKTQVYVVNDIILDIEVKIPEEYMGDIMGDISGKRGKIMGMESDGTFQIIKAQVPQAELYHYATTVRSLTGGRGIHSESFSHYEKMPKEFEQKVVQQRKKTEDE